MQPKFMKRVSVKLIIILTGIILLNLAIYTIYTISNLREDLTESSTQSAYNISDIIRRSTRYSMLKNRKEDIYEIIKTIGGEKGVEKIRIYNKEGSIVFSTVSSEMGTIVDKTGEQACAVCHLNTKPEKNLPMNKMIRFFNVNDKKVLGLINPIRNEKDCSTSECHESEKDKEFLGVLDVIMSTEQIDKIIDDNVRTIITNAVVLTVLISIFSIVFIGVIINRPLNEISKGIDELAKGNLNYKINLKGNNELSNVAKEFNEMSDKLDTAYKEIKEWSETLNQKVTEKNEELKKIYEQITQIEKLASLGTLSATVAHELNNPLEGILTYSKLIAKKLDKQKLPENEKIISFLNLIADESARCGRIVKDLLLFSRQGESENDYSNLIGIMNKSLEIINHHIEIHKIKLSVDYCVEILNVYCDSQKIEQAFIAILMNAIEAMGEGGKLTISIRKEDAQATIRISDEGKGIADKDLPHIFEPFYSTKGGNKGTGLGLAVAYGIISQHKGRLIVENTSDKGTTFKITLQLTNKIKDESNE